jgi:hypothetical protein
MTLNHPVTRTAGQAPWTIARIQITLSNEVLIRRFLLDLTHAPEPRVMEVFTAWQRVAATIEANASSTTGTADCLTPPRAQAEPPEE